MIDVFQLDFITLIPYLYLLGYSFSIMFVVLCILKLKEWYLFFIPLVLGLIYYYYFKSYLYLPNSYVFIGFSTLILLLVFSSGAKKRQPNVNKESIVDVKLETSKGDIFLNAIEDGVLVYASAGSGKTQSVLYPIAKHFAKYQFSGIVYDFKDGELTEMLIPIFDKVDIFALHRPELSIRINPIDPKIVNDEITAGQIAKTLVANLTNTKNGGEASDFFVGTSEAIITAIILKLSFDHPEYCTIPHVISLILAVDFSQTEDEERKDQPGAGQLGDMAFDAFGKLKNFLVSDTRVRMQSASFVLGLANARQTASVLSTLANMLRTLVSPNNFWLLTENTHELAINKEKSRVISILNKPKDKDYLSPINALIIHFITLQMSERHREKAFILLDEAPTIKLANMASIPATMRSFGISTVYCAQDQIQGMNKYGRDGFEEITANLSNVLLGRAFNAKTAQGYEALFEKIVHHSKSTSKNTSKQGLSKGVSLSEREVAKVRAHDFPLLKKGQFAVLSNGIQEVVQLKRQEIPMNKMPIISNVTNEEIKNNFDKIIKDVNVLLSTVYDF